MAETNAPSALVDEMLRYVPAAAPGAVSLQRDSGSLRPGYSLRYLKTREALATGEDAPGVETVEVPIAAAWSVHFVVGVVLILLGMALAVLLPSATHERALALIAVAFVVLGLGELRQSRFTPVGPDRLSIANAVMRARLGALRTDDPGEIAQRVAKRARDRRPAVSYGSAVAKRRSAIVAYRMVTRHQDHAGPRSRPGADVDERA